MAAVWLPFPLARCCSRLLIHVLRVWCFGGAFLTCWCTRITGVLLLTTCATYATYARQRQRGTQPALRRAMLASRFPRARAHSVLWGLSDTSDLSLCCVSVQLSSGDRCTAV